MSIRTTHAFTVERALVVIEQFASGTTPRPNLIEFLKEEDKAITFWPMPKKSKETSQERLQRRYDALAA